MSDFQREFSFERPRRRGGGDRRTLATILADAGASPPAGPPGDLFTREPPPGAGASAAPAPTEPTPAAGAAVGEPAPAVAGDGTTHDGAVPLALSDDDLAALLAAAATEAHGRARTAAEAADAARLAASERALVEAWRAHLDAAAARRGETAELVVGLVRAITAQIIPQAMAAVPLDDLVAELAALLARLETAGAVIVAVHPELEAALAARLEAVAAAVGAAGTVTVRADAELARGDAVVRWPAGEARRHLDDLTAEAMRRCADWLAERDARGSTDTLHGDAADGETT